MAARRLTADEAFAYLGLPSRRALIALLHRRRKAGFPITTYRLGRALRFEPRDLDAAMTVEAGRDVSGASTSTSSRSTGAAANGGTARLRLASSGTRRGA